MEVPWRVWDDVDTSKPLAETADLDSAATMAVELTQAGRDVYLEEPANGTDLVWAGDHFAPKRWFDDVPDVLRDWKFRD